MCHVSRGMQNVIQAQKQPLGQHIAYVSGFNVSNIYNLGAAGGHGRGNILVLNAEEQALLELPSKTNSLVVSG